MPEIGSPTKFQLARFCAKWHKSNLIQILHFSTRSHIHKTWNKNQHILVFFLSNFSSLPLSLCVILNPVFKCTQWIRFLGGFRQLCVFCAKICGEMICQSWPLWTRSFNFCIVQCDFRWNLQAVCHKRAWPIDIDPSEISSRDPILDDTKTDEMITILTNNIKNCNCNWCQKEY